MATQITNYQCPGCTGPLHYVPESGKLECDYCGSGYTPGEIEAFYAAKNEKAADVAADAWDEAHVRAYVCPSCGAELLCDETTAATACPYCGNPTVVPGQFANAKKPDYVIPFKLEKDAAVEALKKHYKGRLLLPKGFAQENHLQEVKGVYVPFWLFDGEAAADVTFEATRSHVHTTPKERITTTEHYVVGRAGRVKFEKIPVDGSSKMPDAHMDAIEPFDYSQMEPFSMAYFPGFLADKYDVDAESSQERAKERCRNSAIAAMENTVTGYSTCIVRNAQVQVETTEIKYALLPVWLLNTRWKDKNYLFAMNGQTGKLIGDLPISAGKMTAWVIGLCAIFASLGWWFFDGDIWGVVGGLMIAAIISLIMAGSMKSAVISTEADAYIPSSGINITARSDRFSHRTVTRQPINNESHSGPKGK